MANANSDGSNTATQQAQFSSVIPLLLGGNQLSHFGVSLNQTPPVKLDRNNYLLYKNMLLVGWLYSSMTPDIAVRVMESSSSSKLWNAVQESFGVMNRSRVTFLIVELQKTRKGSMRIDQYLNAVKQLANNLEIAGKAIHHTDLVTQVLAGLDEQYTPSVVQINSRELSPDLNYSLYS
ncbi:Uncharacterized protein Adt_24598 [Abeliophyllum distichum]|uniref:UBN2 domain-containing protein n=1 Tax=Abeliophyllum distichum TaxID=126358 RepID=A0ABD1SFA5_9LAMI